MRDIELLRQLGFHIKYDIVEKRFRTNGVSTRTCDESATDADIVRSSLQAIIDSLDESEESF